MCKMSQLVIKTTLKLLIIKNEMLNVIAAMSEIVFYILIK